MVRSVEHHSFTHNSSIIEELCNAIDALSNREDPCSDGIGIPPEVIKSDKCAHLEPLHDH